MKIILFAICLSILTSCATQKSCCDKKETTTKTCTKTEKDCCKKK